MSPQEQNAATATLATSPRWYRRRLVVAIVAGMLIVGASSYLALRYFIRCGNCGASPILCTDPCELPKFGQLQNRSTGATRGPAPVTVFSKPALPPHQV